MTDDGKGKTFEETQEEKVVVAETLEETQGTAGGMDAELSAIGAETVGVAGPVGGIQLRVPEIPQGTTTETLGPLNRCQK
jgi:hypothetical protein